MKLAAILLFSTVLYSQTTTQPAALLVSTLYNITSGTQVFDNRSQQRQCNSFTYAVTGGTGAWQAQIEWSSVGPSGPWFSFGSPGVVAYNSAYPIGWAYGYHPWIRINTTAGTTASNFSCENALILPPSPGIGTSISGSLSPGQVVVGASSTSIASSGLNTPHSAFVGVSDTQTLTNKTISYLNNDLVITTGTAVQKANGTGGLTAATGDDFPSALWLNLTDYGGVPNDPSSCTNDTAVGLANIAAAGSNIPTTILFPGGTWYQCSTYNPPPNVQYSGVAQWAQEPEFGAVTGTVLKAGNGFTAGSTLQSNFQIFMGGNSGHDSYGSAVRNMNLDGSGLADGIYVGHVNEQTTLNFLTILNYPHFGLYICGADNGGPCTALGKSGENGAQDDGEYGNLQFSSNTIYGATHSTTAVFLNNVTQNRGIRNVTISPNWVNPGDEPDNGVVMWGIKTNLDNIHGEAMKSLLTLSPTTGVLCPSGCNGTIGSKFTQLDLTNTSGTSYVVDIQGATNSTELFQLIQDNGNTTCRIHYTLNNGYNGCVAHNVSWWMIDSGGIPQSVEDGLTLNSTTVTNGILSVQGAFQWKGGSPTFGTTQIVQDSSGDWTMSFTGTSGNVFFGRGFSTYSFYTGSQFSSLNINPLYDSGNTGMRSSVCNNLRWDHTSQTWIVGANGGGDFGCLGYGNGYTGISTNNGYSSGASVSQANFNANFSSIITNNGHSILGKGSVNADGSINDTGATLQVRGTIYSTGAFSGGTQAIESNNTTCPTAASVGATCTFTVSWPISYGANPYKVAGCELVNPSGFPVITGVTKTGPSITVTVAAVSALASGASAVDCLATP